MTTYDVSKFCGGAIDAEGPIGKAVLSVMSDKKRDLIRGLYNGLKSENVLPKLSGTSDVDTMLQELREIIPNPGVNKKTWVANQAKQEAACKKIAEIVNNVFGNPGMINTNDDAETICGKVYEVMVALTTGTQAEFLRVQGYVKKMLDNMATLKAYMEMVMKQITDQADASEDAETRSKVGELKVAYDTLRGEYDRQVKMLESTFGEIGEIHQNLDKLIFDSSSNKVFDNYLKKKGIPLGSANFGNKVAYTLVAMGNTAYAANLVKSCLEKLGLTIENYKTESYGKFIETLNTALTTKALSASADQIQQLKEAMESVKNTWYLRDDIIKQLKNLPSSSSVSGMGEATYSGGGPDNLKKRIEDIRKSRRTLLGLFVRAFGENVRKLYACAERIHKYVKALKGDVPDKMKDLARVLETFPDLRDRNMYIAISGYNTRDMSAKEQRERFLGNTGATAKLLKELGDLTKESAFVDMATLMEVMMKLVDSFAEKFTEFAVGDRIKKTSGAEEDAVYEGGEATYENLIPSINRSAYEFNQFTDMLRLEIRIAGVRHNLTVVPEQLKSYSEDYPKLLGQAIASQTDKYVKLKNAITLFKDDSSVGVGANIKDVGAEFKSGGLMDKETYDFKAFVSAVIENRIDLLRVAETIDLYLKNFTSGIASDPDNIKDIAFVLDNAEVISKWFTNKSGDYIARVFEYFPYSTDVTDPGGPVFAVTKIPELKHDEHYYTTVSVMCNLGGYAAVKAALDGNDLSSKYIKDSADLTAWLGGVSHPTRVGNATHAPAIAVRGAPEGIALPGLPFLGTKFKNTIVDDLGNSLKITVLKNLLSLFINIGDKFAGKDLSRELHIPPEKIFRILMDYIKYGGLNVLHKGKDDVKFNAFGKDVSGFVVPTRISSGDLGNAPVFVADSGNALVQKSVYTTDGRGMVNVELGGNQDYASGEFKSSPGSHGFAFDYIDVHDGNMVTGTGAGGNAKQLRELYYLGADKTCDDIFVMIIKSMVAKVLVTLGMHNLFNKPIEKQSAIGYHTNLRMIVGGAETQIIEEAIELYIRLPLLCEFYKRIFKTTDFTGLPEADYGGKVGAKVIGLFPEVSGKFSQFINIIFVRNKNVREGQYSDTELRLIIEEINKIYSAYKGKPNAVSCVLDDFIYDINMRYGLIRKEDLAYYTNEFESEKNKMDDSESVFNDQTNFELKGLEESGDMSRPTPSMSYQKEFTSPWTPDNNWSPQINLDKSIKVVKELRSEIDKFFNDAIDPGGNNWDAAEHGENDRTSPWSDRRNLDNFTNKISFVNIITTIKNEAKEAKTDEEKFRVVAQNIMNLSNNTLGHLDKALVAFHETVITPLNMLHLLYKKLLATHLNFIHMHHAVKLLQLMVEDIKGGLGGKTMNLLYGANAGDRFKNGNVAFDKYYSGGLQHDLPTGSQNVLGTGANATTRWYYSDVWDALTDNALARDAHTANTFERFGLNLELLMADLIENIFAHVSACNGLVDYSLDYEYNTFKSGRTADDTYKQVCKVVFLFNNAKLTEHIKRAHDSVKKNINLFRGLLPKHVIDSYEKIETPGSVYWLERALIECLLNGNNPDDLTKVDSEFDVKFAPMSDNGGNEKVFPTGCFLNKNDSLESNSSRVTEVLRFCTRQFKSDGSWTAAAAGVPGANPVNIGNILVGGNLDRIKPDGTRSGNKYDAFHEYTRLMNHLIFYDATKFSDVNGAAHGRRYLLDVDNAGSSRSISVARGSVGDYTGGRKMIANNSLKYVLKRDSNALGSMEFELRNSPVTDNPNNKVSSENLRGIERCMVNETGRTVMGTKNGVLPDMPCIRVYYTNEEAESPKLNVDFRNSIFHIFNKLLLAYLNTLYDSTYKKAFATPVNTLVNGVLSDEIIGNKNHQNNCIHPTTTFINDVTTNEKTSRGKPMQGIMYGSIATSLRMMFTVSVEADKKVHLESDINAIPGLVKQKYREALPYFSMMFETLVKRCLLLKDMVNILNVEQILNNTTMATLVNNHKAPGVSRFASNNYINAFGAPGADPANAGIPLEASRQTMHMILDKFINASKSVINSISDALKAIGNAPRYMELYDNFIETYEANNRTKPFMPLSSSLYTFAKNGFDAFRDDAPNKLFPTHSGGSPGHKLLLGFRGLIEKLPKYEHATGLDIIVKSHNASSENKFHVPDAYSKGIYECYALFFGYLYESLMIKRLMHTLELKNAAGGQTGDRGFMCISETLPADLGADVKDSVGYANVKAPMKGANIVNNVYQLGNGLSVTSIVNLTESIQQRQEVKKITKHVNSQNNAPACNLLSKRETVIAFNIVDMNKIPINIHALMKDIPLINLINYSYTFDKMIMQEFEYVSGVNIKKLTDSGAPLSFLAPDPGVKPDENMKHPDNQKAIARPKNLLAHMAMDPYVPMTYDYYYLVFGQLMRGMSGLEGLSRPRFLAEEIFNKPLFGEIFVSSVADPNELGPASSFDSKLRSGVTVATALSKMRDVLVIPDIMKEIYVLTLAAIINKAAIAGNRLVDVRTTTNTATDIVITDAGKIKLNDSLTNSLKQILNPGSVLLTANEPECNKLFVLEYIIRGGPPGNARVWIDALHDPGYANRTATAVGGPIPNYAPVMASNPANVVVVGTYMTIGLFAYMLFKVIMDAGSRNDIIDMFLTGKFTTNAAKMVGNIPGIVRTNTRLNKLVELVDANPGPQGNTIKILSKNELINYGYIKPILHDNRTVKSIYETIVYQSTDGIAASNDQDNFVQANIANIAAIDFMMSIRSLIVTHTNHSTFMVTAPSRVPDANNSMIDTANPDVHVFGAQHAPYHARMRALLKLLPGVDAAFFSRDNDLTARGLSFADIIEDTRTKGYVELEDIRKYTQQTGIMKFLMYTRDSLEPLNDGQQNTFIDRLFDTLSAIYLTSAQNITVADPRAITDDNFNGIQDDYVANGLDAADIVLPRERLGYMHLRTYSTPLLNDGRVNNRTGGQVPMATIRRELNMLQSPLTAVIMNISEGCYGLSMDCGGFYMDNFVIGVNKISDRLIDMRAIIHAIGGTATAPDMHNDLYGHTNGAVDNTATHLSAFAVTYPAADIQAGPGAARKFIEADDAAITMNIRGTNYNSSDLVADLYLNTCAKTYQDYGIIKSVNDANTIINSVLKMEKSILMGNLSKSCITFGSEFLQDFTHPMDDSKLLDVKDFFTGIYYASFILIKMFNSYTGVKLTNNADALGFAGKPTHVGTNTSINVKSLYSILGPVGTSGANPLDGDNDVGLVTHIGSTMNMAARRNPNARSVMGLSQECYCDAVYRGNGNQSAHSLFKTGGANSYTFACISAIPDRNAAKITQIKENISIADYNKPGLTDEERLQIIGKCCMFLRGQDMLVSSGMQPCGFINKELLNPELRPYFRGLASCGMAIDMLQMYLYYHMLGLFGGDIDTLGGPNQPPAINVNNRDIVRSQDAGVLYRLNEVPLNRFRDSYFSKWVTTAHGLYHANPPAIVNAGPFTGTSNGLFMTCINTANPPGVGAGRLFVHTNATNIDRGIGQLRYQNTFLDHLGAEFDTGVGYDSAANTQFTFGGMMYMGYIPLTTAAGPTDVTQSIMLAPNESYLGTTRTGQVYNNSFDFSHSMYDLSRNVNETIKSVANMYFDAVLVMNTGKSPILGFKVTNPSAMAPNGTNILSTTDISLLSSDLKGLSKPEKIVSSTITDTTNTNNQNLMKLLSQLNTIPGDDGSGETLTYPYRDKTTGKTKIAKVPVGKYKNLLQFIGYLRFNSKFIRNLIWVSNLQRILRYIMRKQLFWYDTKVVNEHPILAVTNTENPGNRLYSDAPEDEGY